MSPSGGEVTLFVARPTDCTAVDQALLKSADGSRVLVEDSTDDVPGAFVGGCIDHSRENY